MYSERGIDMEDMNLNQVLTLSEAQARARYNIGRKKLVEVAARAGALVKLGSRKNLYLRERLDEYLTERGME